VIEPTGVAVIALAPASLAGIVTAATGIITAVAVLITAFGVLIPTLRHTKATEAKVDAQTERVEVVHTIVNQGRTDLRRYVAACVGALVEHGITVPIDQSLYEAPPGSTPAAPPAVEPAVLEPAKPPLPPLTEPAP
jgi:hypothetical protein